jgi:hypothetical protein
MQTERGWRLILISGLLILVCIAFVLTGAVVWLAGAVPGFLVGFVLAFAAGATFVLWMKKRRPIRQT